MNLKVIAIWLFVSAGIIFLISAFRPQQELPLDVVRRQYHENLTATQIAIGELFAAANALDEKKPTSLETLRVALHKTRLAFKRTEYLIERLDPEAVKDNLNGAPLLHFARSSPSMMVVEPEGLQYLDELVFGENPFADKALMLQRIEKLSHFHKEIAAFQRGNNFTDRHVFEAMRFEIIRLLALGITGFDTPGSANALPEAQAVFESMYAALRPYLPYIEKKNSGLSAQLDQKFAEGIAFIQQNNDFDTFDRLAFVRNVLQPLFDQLLQAHLALGIETADLIVGNDKMPVNYKSRYLFGDDLLNPYYFNHLTTSEETPELLELGRTLFFDPVLSANNERACASCHKPELAFTDGEAKSIGMGFNGTVERNAPTLINSIYSDRFFLDLRAHTFAEQVDHVVFNAKEFSTDYLAIITKLSESQAYRALFAAAYRKSAAKGINKHTINTALITYVKSLAGFNSPFDRYIRGETDELPDAAKRGFNLFMGKAACATCHFAPTFSGLVPPSFEENESEVLGVPANADFNNPVLDADLGRWLGNGLREQADHLRHSFKTTTIRNIALTAPYMHNGVYQTLEQVMDFYNKGGGAGMGLDVPNQTLAAEPLNLSKTEIADIVVFMKTLSDTTGMTAKPALLPAFENNPALNNRVIGGKY